MNEPNKPKDFFKIIKTEQTVDYIGVVVARISPEGKILGQKGLKMLADGIYEQIEINEAIDRGEITPTSDPNANGQRA